jgi:hypothetical protein
MIMLFACMVTPLQVNGSWLTLKGIVSNAYGVQQRSCKQTLLLDLFEIKVPPYTYLEFHSLLIACISIKTMIGFLAFMVTKGGVLAN